MSAASSYPDIFNDVFGPIMQPGSSSHLAGPCRVGHLAHNLLGDEPAGIRIVLDKNGSMAGSFGVMAEDNAMLAGALGMLPDDPRVFEAADIARRRGVRVEFIFDELPESSHPNAMRFELTDGEGRCAVLAGESLGSGMIRTKTLNGFPFEYGGECHLLLAFGGDDSGADLIAEIEAKLTGLIEKGRLIEGGEAMYYFKLSQEPAPGVMDACPAGVTLAYLRSLVPVTEYRGRSAPIFDSFEGWRELAEKNGQELWETALEYEVASSGWSRDEVYNGREKVAAAMHRQTSAIYDGERMEEVLPYKYDYASKWSSYSGSGKRICDDLTGRIVELIYGACSCIPGVPTVPGPMGGGGGYLYAAMRAVAERKGLSDEELVRALFVAGGIAAVAMMRTEPTGEMLGCWGECGTCGAMASGAIAAMMGGNADEVEAAASFMLQSCMGTACDPIPGGAGQPCRTRIMTAACMAPVFADMSLAGHRSLLTLSESFDALDRVGRMLHPDLLCNSKGGCAIAPSALRRSEEYSRWVQNSIAEGGARPPVF